MTPAHVRAAALIGDDELNQLELVGLAIVEASELSRLRAIERAYAAVTGKDSTPPAASDALCKHCGAFAYAQPDGDICMLCAASTCDRCHTIHKTGAPATIECLRKNGTVR